MSDEKTKQCDETPNEPDLSVGAVLLWQEETGRALKLPISQETYDEIKAWAKERGL